MRNIQPPAPATRISGSGTAGGARRDHMRRGPVAARRLGDARGGRRGELHRLHRSILAVAHDPVARERHRLTPDDGSDAVNAGREQAGIERDPKAVRAVAEAGRREVTSRLGGLDGPQLHTVELPAHAEATSERAVVERPADQLVADHPVDVSAQRHRAASLRPAWRFGAAAGVAAGRPGARRMAP